MNPVTPHVHQLSLLSFVHAHRVIGRLDLEERGGVTG